MISILSHPSFSDTAATPGMGRRAFVRMTGAGMTMAKDANSNALALRHAP